MANIAGSGSKSDLSQYKGPEGVVKRWLKELELVGESDRQQRFENTGDRIVRKYSNQSDTDTVGTGMWRSGVMYNVLWSNCQVLEPALYSRMPKPVVSRMFNDQDPVALLAGRGLENALNFNMRRQEDKINYVMSMVVLDRLLSGRGTGKIQFGCEWNKKLDENGEPICDEDGEPIQEMVPYSEKVELNYIHWMDYRESVARNQLEVRWRSNRIYKDRDELISMFGEEIGSCIELQETQKNKRKNQDDTQFLEQAVIWVIEDLPSKRALWISPGYQEAPLKQLDDPNKLRDFWSYPYPLVATTTTDSTYPIPDYVIYEGLGDELNFVANRIKNIVNCIRLIGFHSAAFSEKIQDMTTRQDGTTTPMKAWQALKEAGGLQGVMDWLPFDNCIKALPVLQEYQMSLKSQIDEITSMPDIVRGSSDPNDPVYAQQQKAHWTVIKLIKKQQDVQRFCREWVSKMGQMMIEPGFFSDETLTMMAGVPQMSQEDQALWPQALALLRDDRLNTFRLEIETDSTIAIDEEQAQSRWAQYLASMKDILGEIDQVSTMAPQFMSPIIESALAAVRTLRTGRSVEGAWEKALREWEAAKKEAAENPQPPPPDPAMLRATTEAQVAPQEMQLKFGEFQLKQEAQAFTQWKEHRQLEIDTFKTQGDIQVKHEANQVKSGEQMNKAAIDKLFADIQVFEAELKGKIEGVYASLEKERLEFDKKAKVLEMQEKLMEEKRLDRQDRMEHMRIISEHVNTAKEIEANVRAAKEQKPPEKQKPQSPPVVNVHIQGGKKRIRKTEDGYESEPVD